MDEVRAGHPWGDATIKTLLHRLMQKGAVRSAKEDGRQRYHAVLERDVWLDNEIGDLVGRLFDGDFDALVAHVRRSRPNKG
jgi:predicted transcriptional regulator